MHDLRQAERGFPERADEHQATTDQRNEGPELRGRLTRALAEGVPSEPIADHEGAALLDAVLGEDALVAVAVSGGPDSTALLHLTDRWARSRNRRLLVLTVDHGLRAEAAEEASSVAALTRALGHAHRIIPWQGAKPATGLQAAARDARLTLLTSACHAAGAGVLLLAHHREDQAETVLHRIDRDTGPEGLAGMAPESWRDGVRLIRPFLAVSKDRLVATCRAAGLGYADDPSNADPRFSRVQLRRMRADLDAVGLTVDRLTRLAAALGTARQWMEVEVRAWLSAHGVVHGCGTMRFDRAAFVETPETFAAAVLRGALRIAGGGGYPPRTAALSELIGWASSSPAGSRRTLGGCLVEIDGDSVVVLRELAACAPDRTIEAGTACWDGRFLIATAPPMSSGSAPAGRRVGVGSSG
ncbi:MAG: tRNA lysidine(34) synthetase TilS [Thalassobaculum sp.]